MQVCTALTWGPDRGTPVDFLSQRLKTCSSLDVTVIMQVYVSSDCVTIPCGKHHILNVPRTVNGKCDLPVMR